MRNTIIEFHVAIEFVIQFCVVSTAVCRITRTKGLDTLFMEVGVHGSAAVVQAGGGAVTTWEHAFAVGLGLII